MNISVLLMQEIFLNSGDRGSESGTITHDMSDVDECPTNVVSRGSLLFYLTVFGLLLGASSMGSVYGYSSPAVPSLESNSSRIHFDRKRDIDIETLVRSLPFMGSLIGSLSGGECNLIDNDTMIQVTNQKYN